MSTAALEDQRCDVLVVGLGPVGAAIAALLGRYGVRTLVIERERDIVMKPRAIALDNEALRILQMVGLSEDAFAKVPIPHVRMHCPYVGEFARIEMSGEIDGHPKLVTFYQPELERALRDLVDRRSSVRVHAPVELVDLTDEGSSVRATVRELESGRSATIHATYVVGADGARSKVRSLIGQDAKGQRYDEDWLVVDAIGVPRSIDHVEFLCDPRRPTPHMPAPGGRTRWEFMLRPGESTQVMESDETVRALIAPWAGDTEITIERKAVYRFCARTCERFRVGRVFLAGDAAHVTPPFVGQGLVAGLRDAANLSWKLAWAVKGESSPSTLDSYDEERRPHAAKMIALARFMGALIMPQSIGRALLVHGAMKTLRLLPPVRAYVDELGMKPQMAYPSGLFVPGKSPLARGAWLPQAPVRVPSGAVELSDEVLGSGFALLGLGVDPSVSLDPPTAAAWKSLRGSIVALDAERGAAPPERGSAAIAIQSLGARLSSGPAARGRCVVVRPDRTILHDGPAAEARRVVRESLELLGATRALRHAA